MSPRIHGADVIRFLSVVAIVSFHLHDIVYFTAQPAPDLAGSLFEWFFPYLQTFSFSGFTVVAISTFLFGVTLPPTRRWVRLLVVLLVGQLVLFSTWGEEPLIEWNIEWDIFAFLVVSLGSLYFISRRRSAVVVAGILGCIVLWIPAWKISSFTTLATPLRHALIGVCDSDGHGMWPLLPWIGLPWVSFACGYFLREWRSRHPAEGIGPCLSFWEGIAWLAALGVSIPYLGSYFHFSMGAEFACFIHRQEPITFWSHFVWIALAIRLSLDPRVNGRLGSVALLRGLSELHWSRHFGICYLLQLVYIALAETINFRFLFSSLIFNLVWLAMIPMVEFSSRAFFALRGKMRRPCDKIAGEGRRFMKCR